MIDRPPLPSPFPHGGEGTKPVDATSREPEALARNESDPSLACASGSPHAPPLSQILTRRAVDLFAISLVLIVGLTAGREIIYWWRADDVPMATAVADPQNAWSDRPLDIYFGKSTSYARVPFRGSADAAVAELLRQLKTRITAIDDLPSATDDELAWLEKLHELTPAETSEAGAKLYVVPAMFPTVAATLPKLEPTRLAGSAMAMPDGDEAWTLFIFSSSSQTEPSTLAAIRLPDGAQRLFGWNDENSQGVLAFQGAGDVSDWLAHFDAQFGPRLPATAANQGRWNHDSRQFDIQFSAAGAEITGLLWMTTPPARQNTTH